MGAGSDRYPDGSNSLGRVLLISADSSWTAAVTELLEREGYESVVCSLGARAVEQLLETAPSMVLLDLALPDRYGMTVCTLLRTRSSSPIVAVGDRAGERADEQLVRALSAGADVFVSKGISSRELLARVRALIRRAAPNVWQADNDVLRVGSLELDRAARAVHLAGRQIAMTRREFELLEALVVRRGSAVSRSDLLDSMWGARRDPHALDVHVRRLRAKLEAIDPVRRIETVRGVGFRFIVDAEEADAEPAVSV
jgi:two-component system response regulator RegX3